MKQAPRRFDKNSCVASFIFRLGSTLASITPEVFQMKNGNHNNLPSSTCWLFKLLFWHFFPHPFEMLLHCMVPVMFFFF